MFPERTKTSTRIGRPLSKIHELTVGHRQQMLRLFIRTNRLGRRTHRVLQQLEERVRALFGVFNRLETHIIRNRPDRLQSECTTTKRGESTPNKSHCAKEVSKNPSLVEKIQNKKAQSADDTRRYHGHFR